MNNEETHEESDHQQVIDGQDYPEDIHQLSHETTFQKALKWSILVGILIFFCAYFGYILYNIVFVEDSWILNEMKAHFAVTVSMPFAAVVALFIVLLLRYSTGPINIQAPGFKFQGASGPILLWVICFLALVASIKTLWNP
jgi:magnesium-transporting ATPase (P-type)